MQDHTGWVDELIIRWLVRNWESVLEVDYVVISRPWMIFNFHVDDEEGVSKISSPILEFEPQKLLFYGSIIYVLIKLRYNNIY